MSDTAGSSGRRTLGGYEILHELSSGGMGEVLLARKRGAGGFERLAAIKTIRSDLRKLEQLRVMFLDEARLLSRLTHPAVAQVYDFGEDEGTLYLVMEYVAGVSFRELCEERLEPGIACRLMALACRGLHAAHELKDQNGEPLGVVHRDVSPDNLMLTFDGSVQVLDFGIALMRGRQAPVTDYGTIKGKPPYLSPEQIKAEALDRRADIFSASAVLWELLTGDTLFKGDSIYSVGLAVLEHEIPPPSSLVPSVPAELDEVVLHGLARNPDERFQTAMALAEALDAVAVRCGAESLSAFATRELTEAKDAHRRWLTEIRGGSETLPAGRPTGMMTAVGHPPKEPEVSEHSTSVELPRAGRGPWLTFAVVFALVGAFVGFVMFSAPSQSSADPDAAAQVAALATDAAATIPKPDMPIDAAAVAVDAAPPPDARPTRVVKVRDKRIDAGRTKIRKPAKIDAAPKTLGYGKLRIASNPFANVRIDGKNVGTTPIFGYRIAEGRHVVELVSPETGAVVLRRELQVAPGKSYRVVYPR